MELEQFNKMKQELTDKMWLEYKDEEVLFNKRDFTHDFTYKSEGVISSDCMYKEEPLNCVKIINDFLQEVAEHKGITGQINMQTEADGDNYKAWVETIYYSCKCYSFDNNLNKEQFFRQYVKPKFKVKIQVKLQPQKEPYTRNIDCKLMTLYKEGTVDWLTLQKLVYSDCEL